MKKFLFGAAAALAVAAPSAAMAQSGFIEAGYASTDFGVAEFDTWQIGGAAAWGGSGSLGFQIDGAFGSHDSGIGSDVETYNLGGHLFTRSDAYMLGGLVGIGNTDFGGGNEYDYWTVGVEGAYYMSRTTLSGVVAYSDSDDFNQPLRSVDIALTHFFTDNFSVGGALGFGGFEDGIDFTAYGVKGEYQFGAAPLSIFAGYGTTDWEFFDVDVLSIGLRWNFGGSLLERDRSGASLSRNNGLARLGPTD